MARTWPRLAVVGIEPWPPALELARANVRAAGLDGRVELRAESGERLSDEARYDLGWIPSLFIAESVLDAVIAGVYRALRAGAWLILPVLRAEEGSLAGSVVRLRAALWGGSADARGGRSAARGGRFHRPPKLRDRADRRDRFARGAQAARGALERDNFHAALRSRVLFCPALQAVQRP
jgi:hypothetical protein